MDLFSLSGWLIGLSSFLYTVYCQYKNEVSGIRYQQKVDSLKNLLESLKAEKSQLAKTVHDICFDSLLKTKNYPHDNQGLALQREFLTSTLQAVQRVAQEFSDGLVFQGEFIYGSELGAIEKSPDVECVWLSSRDLRPDYDDPELMEQVSNNMVSGKRYRYVVPEITDKRYVEKFVSSIKSLILNNLEDFDYKIAVIYVSEKKHRLLFSGGNVAIYEMKLQRQKRSDSSSICGFEEVIIPNEKRGSLWRRQDNIQSESLLALFKQYETEKRA
jgi:hypothetical protein